MRVRLSDASRLEELRDFYRGVHAIAVCDDTTLDVHLVNQHEPRREQRQLRGHLETWLRLHGQGVTAEVDP